MKKRILSVLTAFVLTFTFIIPYAMPTYAATTDDGAGRFWNDYLNSGADTFDDYINSLGTDTFREGDYGAERGGTFGTPKRFYNQGSQETDGNNVTSIYNDGDTTYTNFISSSYVNATYTDVFTYEGDEYNITDIYYSETYDIYQILTTYNIEENTYNYNFYIDYSPTYTTVMYYDPVTEYNYKTDLYYMLPDGRNSYDLTADDVWGTYFIYDAINYDQVVEDDGTTLGLWHFDGDLSDSSYYNNSLKFTDNAYYKYIESDFNGALSLTDGNVHTLKATLPYDLSSDFTIEGRATFTDSSSANNVVDNYLDGYSQFSNSSSYYYYKKFSPVDGSTDFSNVKSCIQELFNSLDLEFNIDDWLYSSYVSTSYNYTEHTYTYPYTLLIPYETFSPLISVGSLSMVKGSFLSFNNVYIEYYDPNGQSYSARVDIRNDGSSEIPLSYKFNVVYDDNYTFALVRKGDTISYFENGILKNTYTDSSNFGNELLLTVTADQTAVWDELRISDVALYTEDYVPSAQPFDTNLVLVLPSSADETNIAVKSNVVVSDLRVGGVRPTYPTNGYVYVYLEDDVVKDVQQYQTDGWYSVDACIYEDGEWVTLNNYSLSSYVLEDETSTDSGSTDSGSTDSGSTDDSSGDSSTDDTDSESGILNKLVSTITDFIGNLFTSVFGGILDLVNVLIDNLNSLLDSFDGITGLIGSLFGFFPAELVSVLSIGLSAVFIIVIIKMFKG